MKLLQASFARGEVSPLLQARVDLALYQTALAKLKNFIVLPQGGVTRRPGFVRMGDVDIPSSVCPARLIPFRYDSKDAMILEVSPTRVRFWTSSEGLVKKNGVPYVLKTLWDNNGQGDDRWWYTRIEDLADIRYAQSGNRVFLTHRRYPPCMLVRRALDDWTFLPLEFEDGPWFSKSADYADMEITVSDAGMFGVYLAPDDAGFFNADMVGSLFRLDYTVEGAEVSGVSDPGWMETDPVEVGGEWYLETHQKWRGRVQLQKSLDGGDRWLTLRDYRRDNPDDDGQLMLSGAESEKNVVYRVRAQHVGGTPIKFEFSVSGYVRGYTYRLVCLEGDGRMLAHRVYAPGERIGVPFPFFGEGTKVWALGSWNDDTGYPGCIAFYQDRLVLAGSVREPQTVWMSKVGDYKSFGVSDPVRDDDAISITLAADDMDGVHSLVAMSDVLVFTRSGEWKISGAGDAGAISPNAVVAHQQDSIGSASIQPIVVNGGVVMVQAHRSEVHAMRYTLEQDGYSGSDISIMSGHLFGRAEAGAPGSRRIVAMGYQQVPDSLVWFVLEDGTMATCTYQVEHDVIAWARQETRGRVGDVACIPGGYYSQLWAMVLRDGSWRVERLASREEEAVFTDAGQGYESSFETLRVNFDSQYGSTFSSKKLIPRVYAYTIRSKGAWVAPASNVGRNKKRSVKFAYSAFLTESCLMLDAGFERNAALQLWVEGDFPLTLLALSPDVVTGG